MDSLRLSTIMKTDIRGFTNKVGNLSSSDLGALLEEHKTFISTAIQKFGGRIVKGEGDAFWMVFASVTAASLAAVTIQDELLVRQAGIGNEDRLALRIVITAGDILFQEDDIYGDAVNLAARIEDVTPIDEIYLSKAAWLSLNKAEMRTSFVSEFTFKGFSYPVGIYKIDRELKTRIIENQVIVFSDISHYTPFTLNHGIEDVETLLSELDAIHTRVCTKYGGSIRMVMADGYFLTFPDTGLALAAVDALVELWKQFKGSSEIYRDNRMTIGVNRGDLYHYRSSLFGKAITNAAKLQSLALQLTKADRSTVFVSGYLRDTIDDEYWLKRLVQVEIKDQRRGKLLDKVYQLISE